MFNAPRVRRVHYAAALAGVVLCCLTTGAAAQTYSPQLTTDRGCREDGDDPVYEVGELITVRFRVNSATRTSAAVKLFDILNDGRVGVISFGQIATNQTRSFSARIGPPLGIEQLLLQAETASGAERARRSCSFRVVDGTPGPTGTMTPTRTPRPPTPTRTAVKTRTATPTPGGSTPTPGGALQAHVRTNRGCLETGDTARFAIGDPIAVTFRVDSATLPSAQATLRDIFPNGTVKIFSFGTILTNARYILTAHVGPPTGFKVLQLRARNGSSISTNTCTFQVGGLKPRPSRTATPPKPTGTATRTRTP
jgi:hypothetical protein